MNNIHIPPAALEAGARAVIQYRNSAMSEAGIARAAFLAMVEAWPGCEKDDLGPAYLILPLTENPDDKA